MATTHARREERTWTSTPTWTRWTRQFSREIKRPTGEPLTRVATALRDLESELTDFQYTLASTIIQLGIEGAAALVGADAAALIGFIGTAITTLIDVLDTLDSAGHQDRPVQRHRQ
jgi:hypothetical protein